MSIIQTIILSIIEGITEFLPISSTGHLVLASNLLQIPQTEFLKSFEIIIQLGAILSIITLYYKTLMQGISIWKKIILAFIPTGIIGFTLYPFIKSVLLSSPLIVVIALFLGGIVLIILEKLYKEKEEHTQSIASMTNKQAFLIGVCQSIAIVPGISRSGASIMGGLLLGAKRKTAVEFSFLLAIPTMVAATGLDLLESKLAFSPYEYLILLIGFVGSFIVALITVKFFLKYVQNHNFIAFGVYRIILSVLYFLLIIS